MIKSSLVLFACCIFGQVFAQTPGANLIHINSSHTAFPDTGRAHGHVYESKLYSSAEHYQDSTVLIVVPKGFQPSNKVDLVFWFHGWNNSVDSAAIHYQLISQLTASNKNAILVLAETAKNAPDSYGGKLQNSGVFKLLLNDVLAALKSNHIIPTGCKADNIMLAGHSGAYKVMAYILQNGQVPVSSVVLFDALYANTDKFITWIKANEHHRFIDFYTDHGGTDAESLKMLNTLIDYKLPVFKVEEKDVNASLLKNNRILFIHSLNQHDLIINNPDNFKLFLESNLFFKDIRR